MKTLPKLKSDTAVLFNLYANYGGVQTGDIKKLFNVSDTTARSVMNIVYDYCKENGIRLYCTARNKIVPVNALFAVYGWDPEDVVKKHKLLK